MEGYFELFGAMVLKNVEKLSDDEVSPDAKGSNSQLEVATSPKGKGNGKGKGEKKMKRPAAASTPAAASGRSSPLKRPASNKSPKKLKIYKYYYKNLDKFGFKINGSEKMSATGWHYFFDGRHSSFPKFDWGVPSCPFLSSLRPQFKSVPGIGHEKNEEIAVARTATY